MANQPARSGPCRPAVPIHCLACDYCGFIAFGSLRETAAPGRQIALNARSVQLKPFEVDDVEVRLVSGLDLPAVEKAD